MQTIGQQDSPEPTSRVPSKKEARRFIMLQKKCMRLRQEAKDHAASFDMLLPGQADTSFRPQYDSAYTQRNTHSPGEHPFVHRYPLPQPKTAPDNKSQVSRSMSRYQPAYTPFNSQNRTTAPDPFRPRQGQPTPQPHQPRVDRPDPTPIQVAAPSGSGGGGGNDPPDDEGFGGHDPIPPLPPQPPRRQSNARGGGDGGNGDPDDSGDDDDDDYYDDDRPRYHPDRYAPALYGRTPNQHLVSRILRALQKAYSYLPESKPIDLRFHAKFQHRLNNWKRFIDVIRATTSQIPQTAGVVDDFPVVTHMPIAEARIALFRFIETFCLSNTTFLDQLNEMARHWQNTERWYCGVHALQKLYEHYISANNDLRLTQKQVLYNMTMKQNESIVGYCVRFDKALRAYLNVGGNVPDSERVDIFLKGIGEYRFNSVLITVEKFRKIRNVEGDRENVFSDLTLSQVQNELIRDDNHCAQHLIATQSDNRRTRGTRSDSQSIHQITTPSQKSSRSRSRMPDLKEITSRLEKQACIGCGRDGHRLPECKTVTQDIKDDILELARMHNVFSNYKKNKNANNTNSSSRSPQGGRNKPQRQKPSNKPRSDKPEQANTITTPNSGKHNRKPTGKSPADDFNIINCVTTSEEPNNSVMCDEVTLFDSGATSNFCFDVNELTNVESTRTEAKMADGMVAKIKQKGILNLGLQCRKTHKKYVLPLFDTLYLKDLEYRIVSVPKLMERGHEVHFSNHNIRLVIHPREGNPFNIYLSHSLVPPSPRTRQPYPIDVHNINVIEDQKPSASSSQEQEQTQDQTDIESTETQQQHPHTPEQSTATNYEDSVEYAEDDSDHDHAVSVNYRVVPRSKQEAYDYAIQNGASIIEATDISEAWVPEPSSSSSPPAADLSSTDPTTPSTQGTVGYPRLEIDDLIPRSIYIHSDHIMILYSNRTTVLPIHTVVLKRPFMIVPIGSQTELMKHSVDIFHDEKTNRWHVSYESPKSMASLFGADTASKKGP